MDQDAASRRAGKVPSRRELYSTVVIHNDDEEDGEQQDRSSRPIAVALGADDDGGNDLGTMIVKTDRSRPRSQSTSTSSYSSARRGPAPPPPPPAHLPRGSPFADARRGNPIKWAVDEEEKEEEEDGEGFSTFVVRSGERESVSGTVVRRTGGGDVGSTMSRAVASMQPVGDLGFWKQRKGSGSSQGEEARQLAKMSSSSIPESVTREDPTTKYELLNELGKGSYGAVYKARDLKTSELVAIKFISLTEGEEGYEEIQGEIEMLRQCRNPRRRVSLAIFCLADSN